MLASWWLPRISYAQLEIDVDPSQFRKYPIAVAKLNVFDAAQEAVAAPTENPPGEKKDGETEPSAKADKSKKKAEGKKSSGIALEEKSQKILMNDLGIAGIFEVLDPRSFLENPKTAGITQAQIDFTQWMQIGADYLVKGGLWVTDDKVKLDLRLFDVTTGAEKLQKNYEGPKTNFRRMIHAFGDEIMTFFTKQPGIFSTQIVTVRKINKTKQIYLVDFDGHESRVLLNNSTINLLPSWSADGKYIFFTSYMNNNPDLYRINSDDGRKLLKISSFRGLNVGASPSADGKKLALTLSKDGNSEIYIMNVDGSQLRRITHSHAIDSSPTWAPDSRTLAFVSDRSGFPQIYRVDINGGAPVRLTFQGNYNQSPAWSPKGDRVAFCGRDERLVFDLFLVDPATREITRMTQDEGNNEDPSWSPDGRHIVFSSTRKGGSRLYIMNANGSNQRKITDQKGSFSTPKWSPRFQVSP